ncbi:mannitol dehydrogenase [Ilumatobacter coccineus YM16-304]|uniref:Mannitol-1-phosphate 5-dehydrogenase n=1 Tax=Ilumatobacter coccineus (strain NBRC 103263 / KCTC 29153 / YM16-304) TaxID=1313172 RepID=A0A6C7E0Z0_ILUCY|nr:mannitol dehydrogenase [Ilumatobacter coccineus YM16-304]
MPGVLDDTVTLPISADSLRALSTTVVVPDYDRTALRRSIVHIGVGGFHRAHLATYVDDLARRGHTDWSIVGAGVLPFDARIAEVLRRQDHLYTLVSRGAAETDVQVIGSIVDFVHVTDSPDELVARIADPDTQIVSMTITEGGYPVDDVSGEFVADESAPGGAFDVLVAGLAARRATHGHPLTVMSCDNIMTNGRVARTATIGEAAKRSDDLAEWIDTHVSFPNSMVDRITPATTPADIDWLRDEMHISDEWPVVAEPFRQWVVEDDFAGDRLPLEHLDVIVTDDIEPYELTKLRLLNAGHSCLAYLAALDGFERVDEAMADPALRAFVTDLLYTEAKTTLPDAAGIDLDDYISSLIERFSNPGVGDQIARLCLDGSAKFPKFLLPTVRAQLTGDGSIERSALALAGWCQYLATVDAPSADPLLDRAVAHATASRDEPAAFLGFTEVFGADLSGSDAFTRAFVDALAALRGGGVQSAIAALITPD